MASSVISISGKDYEIRFTLKSLVAVERASGFKITEPGFQEYVGSLEGISTLIWAGMLPSNPGITQDEVENMIDIADLGNLSSIITAFTAALPEPDPNGRGPMMPNRARRRSTGRK